MHKTQGRSPKSRHEYDYFGALNFAITTPTGLVLDSRNCFVSENFFKQEFKRDDNF
jgi:hypothetical protein